jgi:hypothetical protein
MRHEEAVFYAGSERVLRASDWAALMAGPMSRDPAGDPQRFAARYPRLAERMSRPQRDVTGPPEASSRTELRTCVEQVVERYAALLHQALDVARSVASGSICSARRRSGKTATVQDSTASVPGSR